MRLAPLKESGTVVVREFQGKRPDILLRPDRKGGLPCGAHRWKSQELCARHAVVRELLKSK